MRNISPLNNVSFESNVMSVAHCSLCLWWHLIWLLLQIWYCMKGGCIVYVWEAKGETENLKKNVRLVSNKFKNKEMSLWAQQMHRQRSFAFTFIPRANILQPNMYASVYVQRANNQRITLPPRCHTFLHSHTPSLCTLWLQGFPFSDQERCQTCSTIPHSEVGPALR